jgi:hypothetical protein
MVMKYHHFMGIGHTYSNAFRPASASTRSTSGQDNRMETPEDDQDQDQEMNDLPPASQIQGGDSEELSDSDSMNTVDNGWWEWEDEGEEDDDDMDGHESDVDLLDMDDMYGT